MILKTTHASDFNCTEKYNHNTNLIAVSMIKRSAQYQHHLCSTKLQTEVCDVSLATCHLRPLTYKLLIRLKFRTHDFCLAITSNPSLALDRGNYESKHVNTKSKSQTQTKQSLAVLFTNKNITAIHWMYQLTGACKRDNNKIQTVSTYDCLGVLW